MIFSVRFFKRSLEQPFNSERGSFNERSLMVINLLFPRVRAEYPRYIDGSVMVLSVYPPISLLIISGVFSRRRRRLDSEARGHTVNIAFIICAVARCDFFHFRTSRYLTLVAPSITLNGEGVAYLRFFKPRHFIKRLMGSLTTSFKKVTE